MDYFSYSMGMGKEDILSRPISRRYFFKYTAGIILGGVAAVEAACQSTQAGSPEDSIFPPDKLTPEFFDDINLKKIREASKTFLPAQIDNIPSRQKLWYISPLQSEMNKLYEIMDRFAMEGIAIGRDGLEKHLLVDFSLRDMQHRLRNDLMLDQQIPPAFVVHLDKDKPSAIAAEHHYAVVADGRNPNFIRMVTFIFPIPFDRLNSDFVFVFNKGLLNNSADKPVLFPVKFSVTSSST